MKALFASCGSVILSERPIPTPGRNEVVVKTIVASLCSADLETVLGSFGAVPDSSDASLDPTTGPARQDFVIGHEAVGIIHEIGEGVEEFTLGQRVLSASTTPCGQCENCQRGFTGHCGGTAWGGYTAGVTRDGVLSEYFVVPAAKFNLTLVPEGVTDEGALAVTDTIASGSSAFEVAGLPLGGTVAVFGQGHVGLAATLTAKLKGAGLVITVKSRPGGEELARRLGADVTLNHEQHDVRAEIKRLTNGAGVDCAVEASGAKSAFALAIESTRAGGNVSVLGSYSDEPDETLQIPLAHWGWGLGDKNIISTFQRCGSERLGRLLRLVDNGRLDLTPLFTHEYKFTDGVQAFSDLQSRQAGVIKPLLRFN